MEAVLKDEAMLTKIKINNLLFIVLSTGWLFNQNKPFNSYRKYSKGDTYSKCLAKKKEVYWDGFLVNQKHGKFSDSGSSLRLQQGNST